MLMWTMSRSEKLIFHIKNKQIATVYDPERNINVGIIHSFILRVGNQCQKLRRQWHTFWRRRVYLMLIIKCVTDSTGKAVNYMTMWAQGVSVPDTVWAGSCETLIKYIESLNDADFPLIVKANNGQKGRDNYLVKSRRKP